MKATLHWVDAGTSLTAQARLYDRLFTEENPEQGGQDFTENLNPDSVIGVDGCQLEAHLSHARPEQVFQFERLGYFCLDSRDTTPELPVFNRTVTLRDTWARVAGAQP